MRKEPKYWKNKERDDLEAGRDTLFVLQKINYLY